MEVNIRLTAEDEQSLAGVIQEFRTRLGRRLQIDVPEETDWRGNWTTEGRFTLWDGSHQARHSSTDPIYEHAVAMGPRRDQSLPRTAAHEMLYRHMADIQWWFSLGTITRTRPIAATLLQPYYRWGFYLLQRANPATIPLRYLLGNLSSFRGENRNEYSYTALIETLHDLVERVHSIEFEENGARLDYESRCFVVAVRESELDVSDAEFKRAIAGIDPLFQATQPALNRLREASLKERRERYPDRPEDAERDWVEWLAECVRPDHPDVLRYRAEQAMQATPWTANCAQCTNVIPVNAQLCQLCRQKEQRAQY